MRLALLPALLLVLAGCLGDENVAPASTLNATDSNKTKDDAQVGVCMIGVNSPCNAPQWRNSTTGGNAPIPPSSHPVGTIKLGSKTVDARAEVTLDLVVEGASEAQIASVLWSLGDGTTAEGASIRHAWESAGLYAIAVAFELRTGGSGAAATILPVRLHETFTGTITFGTGLACAQTGVDCADHNLTVPAGLSNLTASVAPAGPIPPGCDVAAIDPDGTFVKNGPTITIEKPAPGQWTLSVACFGPQTAYTLDALGTFVTA